MTFGLDGFFRTGKDSAMHGASAEFPFDKLGVSLKKNDWPI